jgi:hypothetical protein
MTNFTAETLFNNSIVNVYPKEFFDTSNADGKNNGDGYGNGDVFEAKAGASLTAGQLCYMSGAGGTVEFKLTDADNSSTGIRNLAVCMKTASSGGTSYFLSRGLVSIDTSQITGNIPDINLFLGARLYMDPTTAGNFTITAPTGSGQVTRIVGYIVGYYAQPMINYYKYLIDFRPDNSYIIN